MNVKCCSDNFFAVVLVVIISLIAKPVMGMSVSMEPMSNTLSSISMNTSEAKDPASKTAMNMPVDCHGMMGENQTTTSTAAVQTSMNMMNCASHSGQMNDSCCDMTQCNMVSGWIPTNLAFTTHLLRNTPIPSTLNLNPIARTETLFRPPIA
jgi:microcystin-dependent protein